MFSAMRMAASGIGVQQSFAFGELVAYNSLNHTGQFALPGHPDPLTGEPTVTGFIQIGTPHVGANGSGAQFPPKIGAQAIIQFIDTRQEFPIFSQWYFNSVDVAPFPDGKTAGWSDPTGSSVTTTKDGPTPGDGAGAARVMGKAYTAHGTTGGHLNIQDDINKYAKYLSAGGHFQLFDDANKLINTQTSGGLSTLHNDVTQEIAHIAPHVNLGKIGADMAADEAALNNSHLTTFEGSQYVKRLDDLTKFATAMIAAGVPNAGAVLAQLATLLHIPIPAGSPTVNVSKT